MYKYYDLLPVEDSKHSIFQTIEIVGELTGNTYAHMLHILGFRNTADVKMRIADPPSNHFSIHQVITCKLNELLRSTDIPLRISTKAKPIVMKGRK